MKDFLNSYSYLHYQGRRKLFHGGEGEGAVIKNVGLANMIG